MSLTADQFVDVTMTLIEEKGGSHDVNLREVSRRVGCAHTNAYNYFADFEALLWAAYGKTIEFYGNYLTDGLNSAESDSGYFRSIIEKLARFPMDHPGLYRFIGSDPLPIANMPPDIMNSIAGMKEWFIEIVSMMVGSGVVHADVAEVVDILIAYISGESFDVINGRMLPDEDLPGRIVRNTMRLFTCLSSSMSRGLKDDDWDKTRTRNFPELGFK